MPVVAQYGFRGKDYGLLAIAFPQTRVIRGPIYYEFIPDRKIIVICDDANFSRYPDKEVIQITRYADIQLDTREGFIRFLATNGLEATDYQIDILFEMDDDDFWYHAKLAALFKTFPEIPKEEDAVSGSTMLDLFETLFDDFTQTYHHFCNLVKFRSPKVIFISMMTMMEKARRVRTLPVNPYYRRILEKNRRYDAIFTLAVERFITDSRDRHSEMAVLSFLCSCSEYSRTSPEDFDYRWWPRPGEGLR